MDGRETIQELHSGMRCTEFEKLAVIGATGIVTDAPEYFALVASVYTDMFPFLIPTHVVQLNEDEAALVGNLPPMLFDLNSAAALVAQIEMNARSDGLWAKYVALLDQHRTFAREMADSGKAYVRRCGTCEAPGRLDDQGVVQVEHEPSCPSADA